MNLGELINAVGDDINRTDLTAQCSDAVVMAIRHYDRKRWWFSEGSYTFTTTASTATYTLPTDYREMDYVEVQDTGGRWSEVCPDTFPNIRKRLEVSSTGLPDVYAIRDQKITLAYQPEQTYTVKLWYCKALGTLSASASSQWTTDCADLIRAHAAETVAMRTLHDGELAQFMRGIRLDEYNRLLEENDRRVANDKAEPHY